MIFFDREKNETRYNLVVARRNLPILSHFSAQMTLPDTRNQTTPIFSRGLGLYENLVVIKGTGGGSIEASSATSASTHIRPNRTKEEEEEVSFVSRELRVREKEEGEGDLEIRIRLALYTVKEKVGHATEQNTDGWRVVVLGSAQAFRCP